MSPVELSLASQTASTPSTLWAQPSKEWVIPAKPKPGRKPKKEVTIDTAIPRDDVDEDSSGSRRLQNRAAQRAFRERKQTQLAELQARLHSYEQGEIERNVALQNIAKKMKEENEELRKENHALRQKIAQLEQERDEFLDKDQKRACNDMPTSSPNFPPSDSPTRKRARVDEDIQETLPPTLHPSFPSSSPSLACASDNAVPAPAFPSAVHETHSQQSIFPIPSSVDSILAFTTTTEATNTVDSQDPIDSYTCILCSPDAPCVCKAVQQATNSNSLHHLVVPSESLSISLEQSPHLGPSQPADMSILDDLPAFQAPVPIRRRTGASRIDPVFPVTPLTPTTPPSNSKCSGDPENCMACADDNFGKAFCQAIGHTLNSTQPCVDCPKRTNQTDEILVGGCCGDINKCGSCGIAPIISSATPQRGLETMPTDDAWRQLKSHPNVAFADLTLLAEVVARRSKCTGSRVVLSPALGSPLDQGAQPSHLGSNPTNGDQSILLTDPHEHFHQRQKQRESPPLLVPQHVLIECGRRRIREVNADGVKEALRLLDQKFAHMR